MLLSKRRIELALTSQRWKVWRDGVKIGPDLLTINPHSVNISLGKKFIEVSPVDTDPDGFIDLYDERTLRLDEFEANAIIIRPGRFFLGHARERFDCSEPLGKNDAQHFTQVYEGRSTTARLGLISHCTAGYGDYGFVGNFTLELANLGNAPLKIYAGMEIGQISFMLTSILGTDRKNCYLGKYNETQFDRPQGPIIGRKRFERFP